MVKSIFYRFSFWADIMRYIGHVTIYPLVNEMENVGEINIFLNFELFGLKPIKPNSLMHEPIYINIIEFPISHSPINLIDRQSDASLLPLPLRSLTWLSNCIKEAVIEPHTCLSRLPVPTIEIPDLDDLVNPNDDLDNSWVDD